MAVRGWLILGFLGLLLACAGVAPTPPIPVSPLVPGASERVVVDQALLLIDASSSIGRRGFPSEKALVEAFVHAMPEGSYDSGAIAFGGFERDTSPLASFDRPRLETYASRLVHIGEGSPIYAVLDEAAAAFAGRGGRAAVFLFSDGLPTDPVGREVDVERTLAAAQDLAQGHGGTVCFHTIQIGSDPQGADLLRRLADTTDCGSPRNVSTLRDATSIHAFQRMALLGGAAPRSTPTEGDADRDGVVDSRDQCPDSPAGVRVDARGCWVLDWLYFATDSAELDGEARRRLQDEVVPVLEQNPRLVLRVDGHTDAQGAAAYNQALSERRARSVRGYLIDAGIDPTRIEMKGFGEAKPVASNATVDGRRQNRRTELTVVR